MEMQLLKFFRKFPRSFYQFCIFLITLRAKINYFLLIAIELKLQYT